MHPLYDLSGKVALVTGGAGGLGRVIVRTLAELGATVLLSDRDKSVCEAEAQRVSAQGHQVYGIACDFSNGEEVTILMNTVEDQWGTVDALVCNVGIQGHVGSILDIDAADWERVMTINLKSALDLCSRVIPGMAKKGGGSVVLMSSIAGLRGNKAIGLYALSKAGLAQLARNLAVEWGPSGVRVNAISPGLIRTPLAENLLNDGTFMERRLALTPLCRVGEPEEVAGVVAMLASRSGGFITGQNLVVDGGTLISDGN